MSMEQLLKYLFDYQRFQPNLRLAELIADTEQRVGLSGRPDPGWNRKQNMELSDDDLELVNAAGELPIPVTLEEYQDD